MTQPRCITNVSICGGLLAMALLAGCAAEKPRYGPSVEYEVSTAKSARQDCPTGYVLNCESKKTGRIRFGRIGNQNLESCSCEEYRGMPTQSPLPGIQ